MPASRRLWSWLLPLWSLLLWLPLPGETASLIRSQSVLEDRSGQLGIEDVAGAGDFQPLEGVLVGGYTDSAHWLRLQVAPAAASSRESSGGDMLLLRVRPTFVDDLRLYQQDANGRWRESRSGDRQAFDSAQRSLNALGFEIRPQAPYSTYYLRLQTSSSAILHVQALPRSQAAQKDAWLLMFQVAYLAFMSGVLLWSAHAWWRGREAVMGTFAIYQACSLIHATALMGYLAPFGGPGASGWSDALSSIFVLLTAGSGFLFHGVVLRMYAPQRGLLVALWALLACVPVLLALYLTGHERLALQLNALAVLVCGMLMFLLAMTARREGLPSLRVLRTVYVLQSLSIAASMLPFLGWIRAVEWSLQSSLIHGLISACLMAYMLDQRARLLRAQAEGDHQRVVLAEQRLQMQAEQVQAQERFIDVLTHELKTPISVAMMSLGASQEQPAHLDRARRAIGNLDAIVERTRMSVLADHQRLQAQLAPCNVSVLVYECIEDSRAPERIRAKVGFELEALTDAQLLGLIVTNLIDNALKYSPADSTVDVSLQAQTQGDQDGLWLCVSNDVGAAGAPDPSHLFQKYYRSAGAQSQSGSGLGLFLSQHLASLLGARLSHRPQRTGVEFALFIPLKGPARA